jgi:hypothetical protein
MKKMNYLLFALSLSLLAFNLPAQSLERFVIGSAGISSQNENIQLSFTVGEPVVSSFHTDEVQLNQGFQQIHVEDIPTGIELPAYIQAIIAYPNPVGTTLYMDVNTSKVFEFSVEVYNLSGQQQGFTADFLSTIGNSQHQIDLIGLVPGIYLLMIKTKEGYPVKTLKIQKM